MAKTKAPAVKPRRAKSSNAEPPTATPASETCPGETAEETIARHRAWIRAQLTKLIALRSKALEYNSYGPLPDSTRLDPRSPAWRQQRELARRLGQHEEMLTKLVIRTAVRWLLILDHATVETLQVIEEAILFAHYETALSSARQRATQQARIRGCREAVGLGTDHLEQREETQGTTQRD